MADVPGADGAGRSRRPHETRWIHDNYGLVFVCTLVTLVVIAVLGDLQAGRALGIVLLGAIFVLTLRASSVSRFRSFVAAVAVVLALVAVVVAAVAGATSAARGIAVVVSAALVIASPVAIIRRLIRHHEVSVRTVMGALCLYLFLGLFFTYVYVACGLVQHGPFFARSTEPRSLDYMYFSLATLTTVGYGDLSPATDVGRMIAVIEAIVGQLYLVTIIALLVGNLALRRGKDRDSGAGTD